MRWRGRRKGKSVCKHMDESTGGHIGQAQAHRRSTATQENGQIGEGTVKYPRVGDGREGGEHGRQKERGKEKELKEQGQVRRKVGGRVGEWGRGRREQLGGG